MPSSNTQHPTPNPKRMNYKEAYNYINSFTNYEQVPGINVDPGLEGLRRVRLLMRLLKQPHKEFKSVLVAGTKGKGSVAAMIDSVLRQAGHKTGLYTSPHLHTFRERIRVGGELISPGDMARIVETLQPAVDKIRDLGDPQLVPTTYELATAIAFLYFREMGVEIAVLEVGLGGRLDATNIVEPLVSIINSISLDHTEILGDTLAAIAGEKAGIIKPGGKVISAPQHPEAMAVIENTAREQGAQLAVVGREVYISTDHLPEVVADEEGVPAYQAFTVAFEPDINKTPVRLRLKLPLLGNHQQLNAAIAVAALGVLAGAGIDIDTGAIIRGFDWVEWPGRLEIVSRNPVVIVDGAHNVDSIEKLNVAISELFHRQKIILVLGISKGHDAEGIVQEISAWSDGGVGSMLDRVIVTHSQHPRACDPMEIANYALRRGLTVEIRESVGEALKRAESVAGTLTRGESAPPVILVTGSLFVVAEAREHYGLALDLSEEDAPGG